MLIHSAPYSIFVVIVAPFSTNKKKLFPIFLISSLNGNLANGNISFGQDTEGNWGYIPSGADAVIPFKPKACIAPYMSTLHHGSIASNAITYYKDNSATQVICTGKASVGTIKIYASDEKFTTVSDNILIVNQSLTTTETEYIFDIAKSNGKPYEYIAISLGCTAGSQSASASLSVPNITFK